MIRFTVSNIAGLVGCGQGEGVASRLIRSSR